MVSACILTFKRQKNLARIVEHLSSKPYVGEILIRDQSKLENLKCMGRYALARQARQETVLFTDDDCIVHNLDEIYEAYVADPDRMAFGLAPSHYPIWEKGTWKYPNCQLGMVGWGAFVKREWCSEEAFAPYVAAYGADPMLFREADRIFTMLLRRHHNVVLADVEQLPGNSEGAMWQEQDHFTSRDEAVARCLEIL